VVVKSEREPAISLFTDALRSVSNWSALKSQVFGLRVIAFNEPFPGALGRPGPVVDIAASNGCGRAAPAWVPQERRLIGLPL